ASRLVEQNANRGIVRIALRRLLYHLERVLKCGCGFGGLVQTWAVAAAEDHPFAPENHEPGILTSPHAGELRGLQKAPCLADNLHRSIQVARDAREIRKQTQSGRQGVIRGRKGSSHLRGLANVDKGLVMTVHIPVRLRGVVKEPCQLSSLRLGRSSQREQRVDPCDRCPRL